MAQCAPKHELSRASAPGATPIRHRRHRVQRRPFRSLTKSSRCTRRRTQRRRGPSVGARTTWTVGGWESWKPPTDDDEGCDCLHVNLCGADLNIGGPVYNGGGGSTLVSHSVGGLLPAPLGVACFRCGQGLQETPSRRRPRRWIHSYIDDDGALNGLLVPSGMGEASNNGACMNASAPADALCCKDHRLQAYSGTPQGGKQRGGWRSDSARPNAPPAPPIQGKAWLNYAAFVETGPNRHGPTVPSPSSQMSHRFERS